MQPLTGLCAAIGTLVGYYYRYGSPNGLGGVYG